MSWRKSYGLLACLYIAQGLPYGFFMQALPALLRTEGMSLEAIGFSVVLVLPWALKFLWAPFLDKWGHRKFWIIGANLCAVLSMLWMSMFELSYLVSSGMTMLFVGFFLMNLFTATQDIATDGLAVNRLTEEQRGIGNGIQVAGYRVGMILAGGALLAWFTVIGWQYSMWILATLMLLFTLPAIFMDDIDNTEAHDKAQKNLQIKDFFAFFKLPNMGIWLLIILTYKFGDYFAGTMVKPMLVDIGLDMEDIAIMVGTVGFFAGLLGAMVGGFLVTVFGRFHALMMFCCLQAFSAFSWFVVPLGLQDMVLLYGLSFIEYFTGGLATAALFTVMMDNCRPECAGSDYTIQSCMVVLMNMVSASLSGVAASNLGYELHFAISGVLSLAAVPLIIKYRHHFIVKKVEFAQ